MTIGQRPISYAMKRMLVTEIRLRLNLTSLQYVVPHHYSDNSDGVQVEYEIRSNVNEKEKITFGRITL